MQVQTTYPLDADTTLVSLATFKAQLVIPAAVFHPQILPNCAS
jgi:hypothetical protein